MLDPFTSALAEALDGLGQTLGCLAIWKDAARALSWNLGQERTLHLHAFCRAVKAAPGRFARCLHEDNPGPADFPSDRRAPRLRICHAGVAEVLAPVFAGPDYVGCVFVGPFRCPGCRPLRLPAAADLPELPVARVLAATRLFTALVVHLDRERAQQRAVSGLRQNTPPAIAEAFRILHGEARNDLRAFVVARRVGLSSSRFVHGFKEAAGDTWSAVLRRAVMQRARDLLSRGEPIQDVASALGFASASAFSTAFRRVHLCAPSLFRQHLERAEA